MSPPEIFIPFSVSPSFPYYFINSFSGFWKDLFIWKNYNSYFALDSLNYFYETTLKIFFPPLCMFSLNSFILLFTRCKPTEYTVLTAKLLFLSFPPKGYLFSKRRKCSISMLLICFKAKSSSLFSLCSSAFSRTYIGWNGVAVQGNFSQTEVLMLSLNLPIYLQNVAYTFAASCFSNSKASCYFFLSFYN